MEKLVDLLLAAQYTAFCPPPASACHMALGFCLYGVGSQGVVFRTCYSRCAGSWLSFESKSGR
jgi:hypothetical protein